jgi:hypothetical protein
LINFPIIILDQSIVIKSHCIGKDAGVRGPDGGPIKQRLLWFEVGCDSPALTWDPVAFLMTDEHVSTEGYSGGPQRQFLGIENQSN